MKLKKFFLSVFIMCLIFSINIMPVMAEGENNTTETTETGSTEETSSTEKTSETENTDTSDVEFNTIYIKSLYSNNIKSHDGDIFEITYKLEGYSDEAVIKVDASTMTENAASAELPVSNYVITGIKYVGDNENIVTQGYAVNKYYKVYSKAESAVDINNNENNETTEVNSETTEENIDTEVSEGSDNKKNNKNENNIIIAIGKEQVDSLKSSFDEVVVVTGEDTSKTKTEGSTDNYEYVKEDISYDMEYNEDYGVEEQVQDGSQTPEVEHYKDIEEIEEEDEEDNNKKKSRTGSLLLVFVLLAGGGGVFIWVRKHS